MISDKWLDEKIRDVYNILKNKGYETIASCQGHVVKLAGRPEVSFSPIMMVFKDVPILKPWLPSDIRWAACITYRSTYGTHVPFLTVFYQPENFKESEQELDIVRAEMVEWARKQPNVKRG